MDSWKTFRIPMIGGLRLNLSPLEQGVNHIGSLITATNFEPADVSGYRRISGYSKFDSAAVTGTGAVLGVFVWNGQVVAMRGTEVYQSSGSGWTAINGANTRPGALKYHGTVYSWGGTERITFCDQVNDPAKWDGTTYTVLTGAPAGTQWVAEHSGHMFFAKDDVLTFSAPYDETDFAPANGAGAINVGFNITGIASWRKELYVFGYNKISKVTGSALADFAIESVSKKLGCVTGWSIQEIAGDLVFLSHDGVRTIAGTERLNDVEMGSISEPIKTLLKHVDQTYVNGSISSVSVVDKAQYRLFTALSTDDATTARGYLGGLRGDVNNNVSWEWGLLEGIHVACADSGHISGTEYVIHGGWDGYVYRQENGDTFAGADVLAVISTPYITFDDPALRKVLHKMEIFIEVEGSTDMRVSTVFDYNESDVLQPPEISVSTSDESFSTYDDSAYVYDAVDAMYDTLPEIQTKFNLVGSCLNCSFTFSSNDSLSPYTIKEIVLRYAVHGGR